MILPPWLLRFGSVVLRKLPVHVGWNVLCKVAILYGLLLSGLTMVWACSALITHFI